MMWRRPWVLWCVIALVWSGCLAVDEGGDDPEQGRAAMHGAAAWPSTFYLDPDARLVPLPGDDGSTATGGEVPDAAVNQPLAWSVGEWYRGLQAPTWTGPAADRSYLVRSATIHVTYVALETVSSLHARPEFTSWFGAGNGTVAHLFGDGPAVFERGDVQEVSWDVALPPGGLVVEQGRPLIVRVADYYSEADETPRVAARLMDPDALTRIEMDVVPIALVQGDDESYIETSGELIGDRCVFGTPPGQRHMHTYDIEVAEYTVALHVDLWQRAHRAGGHDVDVILRGPDGGFVVEGGSPGSREAVSLYTPNFDSVGRGTWTLEVFACQTQSSDYDLHVTRTAAL